MNAITDFAAQLQRMWNNMAGRQQAALGGLAAVVLLGFGWVIFGQAPVEQQILFSGLGAEDAAAITEKLRKDKEPFELTEQGTTVRVNAGRVHQLRLQLTSDGLPRGSGVGFEIFDGGAMGMSQFLQNLNYKRGLEGELARTISGLAEVRSARIHLALPKRRLFKEDEVRPTASVVLQLNGSGLNRKSIKGISHLIAQAVEGLNARDVTIVDSEGNVLQRASDEDGFAAMSFMEEQVRTRERDLEGRLIRLLESVVGIGRAKVQVAMAYNFDAVTQKADRYDPERQIARSEQRTDEKRKTDGLKDNRGAGADANNPDRGNVAAAGGGSLTERGTEQINYEIDKLTEHTRRQTGVLTKMSIAVLVDEVALKPGAAAQPVVEGEPAAAPAVDLDKLKTLVAKAAGVDKKRGDELEFASIPFATPLRLPEASAFDVGSLAPFFQGLVAVVIALMMVFLVVRPLLGQLRTVAPDLVEAAALPGTVEDVAARLEDAEREAKARRLMEQRDTLVAYASSEPERTAEILRGWLTEGA
jgi:flagellar M-ring protein FliF